MNQIIHSVMLTDQLERQLIQQEIYRQHSAPAFNFRRVADRIAAVFGYVRAQARDTLADARPAH